MYIGVVILNNAIGQLCFYISFWISVHNVDISSLSWHLFSQSAFFMSTCALYFHYHYYYYTFVPEFINFDKTIYVTSKLYEVFMNAKTRVRVY